MPYCSHCGSQLIREVPPDDNRQRDVCPRCQTIFYKNPRVVVGAIVRRQDRILLCKRAIEPAYGKWTLPGGFMEVDESSEEGAIRETMEEAGASIRIDRLFATYNWTELGLVHLIYLATMIEETILPGPESLDARLFTTEEIPWDELAFSSTRFALESFRDGPPLSGVHEGSNGPLPGTSN